MKIDFAEKFVNFIVHAPLTRLKNCDAYKIFIKSLSLLFTHKKAIND